MSSLKTSTWLSTTTTQTDSIRRHHQCHHCDYPQQKYFYYYWCASNCSGGDGANQNNLLIKQPLPSSFEISSKGVMDNDDNDVKINLSSISDLVVGAASILPLSLSLSRRINHLLQKQHQHQLVSIASKQHQKELPMLPKMPKDDGNLFVVNNNNRRLDKTREKGGNNAPTPATAATIITTTKQEQNYSPTLTTSKKGTNCSKDATLFTMPTMMMMNSTMIVASNDSHYFSVQHDHNHCKNDNTTISKLNNDNDKNNQASCHTNFTTTSGHVKSKRRRRKQNKKGQLPTSLNFPCDDRGNNTNNNNNQWFTKNSYQKYPKKMDLNPFSYFLFHCTNMKIKNYYNNSSSLLPGSISSSSSSSSRWFTTIILILLFYLSSMFIPVISSQSHHNNYDYNHYPSQYGYPSQSDQQNYRTITPYQTGTFSDGQQQQQQQHPGYSPNNNNRNDNDNYLPHSFQGGEIIGTKYLTKRTFSNSYGDGSQPSTSPLSSSSSNSIINQPDYEIRMDIVIPSGNRLIIEPGVQLAFHQGVGILVHGVLNATGTTSSKIIFTSLNSAEQKYSGFDRSINSKPLWPDVRLVDGNSINEGRLQIKYKGRWHSVCTNSRNWTHSDVQVVCRQLGFADGDWFRWFLRNNDTRQFMYENPGCRGAEQSLQECTHWHQKRTGSGVCDFHQDIGIRCDNELTYKPTNRKYWRGIEFINADSHIKSVMSNKMEIRVSDSVLENVIIEYAGQDNYKKGRAALLTVGSVPPHINELKIYRSAYTALNVTDPVNGFEIMNSNFSENRAYGIYINSSNGRVLLSSVEVENNGADGVRLIHFDKPYYSSDNFCETPNLGTSQVFPIKYTHRQSSSKTPSEECCQEFYSKDWEGQRITVHFPILMSGIEDYAAMSEYLSQPYIPNVGREGSIFVVDGHSGRIIADFFIRNDTKTQSVSSIVGNGPLKVCYRPAHYRRVLFTVQVVVDYGREYDLVITNSRIVANNGRGLWLQDLRSGAVINRTLIASHDHVAGLDVDKGVGEIIVNNSLITDNLVDGINITNGGGFLHIDRSDIVNNTGRGIAVWFNESMNLQAFNHSSHVTRCALSNNRIGLLIFNGCHFISPLRQSSFWNISLNHFERQSEQGLIYHSCIPRPRILRMQMKPIMTNISISHNRFVANDLQAIHVAPLFFAKLSIAHNEFSEHHKAVLYINSQDSFNEQNFIEDAERFPFSFYNTDHSLTNQRISALDLWPAVVRIRNNNFNRNEGYYVANIGLLEPESTSNVNFNSLAQRIYFTRNILHDNRIYEPFEYLNPRSRVAAVLCVSSSNVVVWRNEFVNPYSRYEFGVHLNAHFRSINASQNYWGTLNHRGISSQESTNDKINDRIFDRKNRYNLAQVEFLPYILIPNALESDRSALSLVNDREKIDQFFHGISSGEIGGQVKGQVNLPPGSYYVKRDIYISPEGELVLNPGTTLHFDQSVGVLVQGKFKAKGHKNHNIKFLLASKTLNRIKRQTINSTKNETNLIPSNTTITARQSIPLKARLTSSSPSQNVRLSNGTEGRLEVKIGSEWGTVCGYNFDIEDAAVACQQLGLVLNKRDWRLEKSEFWSPGSSRTVLLTNVQCTHLDTDLTKCKAEKMSDNDFEGGWCPKGEVGIRCFPEAWAGIRFGMLTQEVILEHITVEKAGLLDYRTSVFGPAIQFDFNRFSIRDSVIQSNIDSGLGILWNDVISEPNDDRLQISNSKIMGNLNHGIITQSQGIKIENCLISDNKVSGFHYEPKFSREHQEELASWIVKQPIHYRKASVFIISPGETPSNQSIYLGDIGKQVYIYVPKRPKSTSSPFNILIQTDPGKRIGVMALSPIFLTRSSETLRLYSPLIDSNHAAKMMWDMRRNLTMFPFIYPGYRMTLEYSTGEIPYGGILLLVTPKLYPRSIPGDPSFAEKSLLEQLQMNTMTLLDNQFIQNGKGITSSHCSMNIDLNGNYCKRYCNETIFIQNNLIAKSKGAGLFVNSHAYSSMIPYSLLVNMLEYNEMPQQEYDITYASSIVAEINYTLVENRFLENADFGSIVLYDHSLYSNGDMQRVNLQSMPGFIMSNAIGANHPSNTNLFHWHIRKCTLEQNKNGGIDLRLPYTWLYNENFTHTIVIEESNFINNQNFELLIGGHYAEVNITRNKLLENQCKVGLISIRGMEKSTRIENNDMNDNFVQKYVLEMNMGSHADKFGTVPALIHRNIIRNNRFSGSNIRDSYSNEDSNSYTPETYSISIRGLQQVNVTRNILINRNLQFELLSGVRAGSIHNELNAKENFWGTNGDPQSIQSRIFDFDDWNSFSTSIFSPWLTTDRFDAPLVYDRPMPNENKYPQAPNQLGGRLTESLVLHAREHPYVVNTDLTVMPGTILTIRPGVVMEFHPSVGILVLGDLNAIGREDKPIIMRPINRNSSARNWEKDIPYKLGFRSSSDTRKRHIPMTEQLVYSKSDHGGVRLCLTEICDKESEAKAEETLKKKYFWLDDSGYPQLSNERKRHGFLEIYNTTTLQWTPICDPRFTERDAQVVCRQLGFSTLNVFVRRGPRPDMDPTLMTRITDWPESLECTGTESSLAECEFRTFSKDSYDRKSTLFENAPLYHSKLTSANFYRKTHYNLVGDNRTQELMFYLNDDWRSLEERSLVQSTACQHDGQEFVYIFCGEDNNRNDATTFEHWGGVRFAIPEFEEDESKYSSNKPFSKSTMQFVNMIGAGILHGEKNAAIQMIQRSIPMEFVNVQNSAYHAVETLAPPESLKLHRLRLENNLGAGVNTLLLGTTTSLGETSRVPYEPISDGSPFSVPYNAFSLVDICDARKQLKVKEKVYVYYKYDNRPVDCVKIFTSANPLKRIGIRFLQLNLWSKFAESEGRYTTIDDDYIEGKKFAYPTEDIFHNKIRKLEDEISSSFVDASLINSMSDSIMIWDGDIFNETTRRLIGEVYSDSTRKFFKQPPIFNQNFNGHRKHSRNSRYVSSTRHPPTLMNIGESDNNPKNTLYQSTGFSMSIQLHVSGASSRYGFIAEVTTLPSAYYDERNIQHNITYSEILDNTAGAVMFQSVGESVPQMALLNNLYKRNCRILWANFSTCDGNSIDLKMQNSPHLYFQNNLISNNRAGGLRILATSFTAVSALNAHLINNLFADNYQKEALYFEGANSYQTINADRNYFSRNRSPHKSNIVFGKAIVKFHENVIINNFGDNQLFVAGFAHAQTSSKLQVCTKNFFYNNHANNKRGEKSTIIASTVGQIYKDNYLVNPDNDFELATRNRTIINAARHSLKQNIIEPTSFAAILASAIIEAPYNWWGFNETSAVEARIRDSRDSYHLIPVQFQPFYSGNWSVLSGTCYGGYQKIADTCYVYVGGRMNYHQARKFCGQDNSSMPFVRASNIDELTRYIYLQQPLFDRRKHAVWVQSFDVAIGSCSVLIDGSVREHDCNDELPFLCERDPVIGISSATLDYWYQEPLGMAVIGISILTLLLTMACICCWICKSRHRHLEKLERRNSIRASIRSSRSLASMSALNDSNYFNTQRKLLSDSNPNINGNTINRSMPQLNGTIINDHGQKKPSLPSQTFDDSLSATYHFTNTPRPDERLVQAQTRFNDAVKSNGRNPNLSRSTNYLQQPFDLVFENQAFKGQSTPISPVSFSSREDPNIGIRPWTPETNSTLDFKVKPALDPHMESSQYTGSTEDLQKPPPSTSSSSAASDLPSPSSVQSRNSDFKAPRFFKPKPQLKSPVNPPPPPPVRRLIQQKEQEKRQQQRRSMDPSYLLHNVAEEPMETTFDGELLTFGQMKQPEGEHKMRPTYVTDLDGDHHPQRMGGSQPSLMYGSYTPSSIATQESNNPYLETSLDNESFYNENFGIVRPAPRIPDSSTTYAATNKARLYASQPLETSM